LPNGHKIYDSCFKPIGTRIGTKSENYFNGQYINCTFDANDYHLFSSGANKNLKFYKCRFINIDQHTIVEYSQFYSSIVLDFEDCYFDGHTIASLSDAETYIVSNTTNATIFINGIELSSTPISNNYIPAPTLASSGDFLRYDGTAWDAATVPSGNGVSF
jgi:hypothetical protein